MIIGSLILLIPVGQASRRLKISCLDERLKLFILKYNKLFY